MIRKKAIVGILAALVLFTTVQGIKPVLADNSGGNNAFVIYVRNGEGKVCWSGAYNGCTESSASLTLQNGMTLTITATGTHGYKFIDYDSGSSTTNTYLTMNPYTITMNGNGQYISADFEPEANWYGVGP